MNILDEAVHKQSEIAGMLMKRLGALMRSDQPIRGEDAGEATESDICPFASVIREYRYVVETTTRRLSNIIDRLEL